MRFTDKVALITAAASGIGRATADIMAREGAVVVAVDNHASRLDATVAALRAAGGRAYGRRVDALDAAQVDALVASVPRSSVRSTSWSTPSAAARSSRIRARQWTS